MSVCILTLLLPVPNPVPGLDELDWMDNAWEHHCCQKLSTFFIHSTLMASQSQAEFTNFYLLFNFLAVFLSIYHDTTHLIQGSLSFPHRPMREIMEDNNGIAVTSSRGCSLALGCLPRSFLCSGISLARSGIPSLRSLTRSPPSSNILCLSLRSRQCFIKILS